MFRYNIHSSFSVHCVQSYFGMICCCSFFDVSVIAAVILAIFVVVVGSGSGGGGASAATAVAIALGNVLYTC